MSNKKVLLTLGAGYICTHVSNIKRVKVNEDLKCYDNYIKVDYSIIKEYVDKINGLNLRITPRESRLLKLEMNESNTYNFNGEKLIEYLTLDYVGADKTKRLKRVLKIVLDNIFDLPKKDFINTISEIMANIETSLSIKDLVSLGVYSLKLNSSDIEEYNFEMGEKLLVVQ